MSDPIGKDPDGPKQVSHPPTVDEILRASGGQRNLKRFPRLVIDAFALVWVSARRHFVVTGFLQVVGGLALAAQLLVLRRFLDRFENAVDLPSLRALALELVLFSVLLVVIAVSTVVQREQRLILSELVQKYTTDQVLGVATTVDLIEFDRPTFYDRLQRATVNAGMRPIQIVDGIFGLLKGGSAVVAVAATLLFIEPIIAALVVAGGVPAVIVNRLSSRIMHDFAVRNTSGDRRRLYLYQVLTRKAEAQEIRAFESSSFLRSEYTKIYERRIADLQRTVRKRMTYGTISGTIAAFTTVGSMVLLLHFVSIGRLQLSDAAVAVGAVVIIAGQLRGLIGGAGLIYEGALFLQDFTEFLALPDAISRMSRDSPQLDNSKLSLGVRSSSYGYQTRNASSQIKPFKQLEFQDVSFTYPNAVEPSLVGVSLTIKRGEIVALVGENGSGKTTLTKLLAGLYRPTRGQILWNGQVLSAMDLAQVRELVTVIFQDFARYFLSASENIAISRVEEIDNWSLVRAAAARAGADHFLDALPSGYESLLGPAFLGGYDLSTGQWQRVALARAYFRNSPILILDEPTASLDPKGEYEVFEQVRRIASGRTVVLTSHRFSNVRAADRIVVLSGGRVAEQGDHKSLLSRGGLYADLYDLQARGYRDGPS